MPHCFHHGWSTPQTEKCEIVPLVPISRSDHTICDLVANICTLVALAQEMIDAGWTAQAERLIEDVYALFDQFS
jgi:hypothetical protein